MRRREFARFLGSALAAWPLAARAQHATKPVIGFLGMASPTTFAARLEGFRSGLRDFGYLEGTNITVEYRFAEGHYERLPELAADLVRSKVDLIVTHGTPGSLAAKQATTTIPIVITSVGDPVATGIVASIARPGGNITGQTFFNPELRAKRIEVLKEVMPHTHVAVILNVDNPAAIGPEFQAMETAAQALNIKLQAFRLREASEFCERVPENGRNARRGSRDRRRPLIYWQRRGNCGAGGKGTATLDWSGICPKSRWRNRLRRRHYSCTLSPLGLLRRQGSQRCQTRRSPNRAGIEVSVHPKSSSVECIQSNSSTPRLLLDHKEAVR
jgi:ABC transporter substrate binding protein